MKINSKSIDTDILLRAIAICAVVFNHAHDLAQTAFGYGGGMTVLMMISGYSFARFALDSEDIQSASYKALKFAWNIAWPSLLLIALYSIARQKVNFYEIFLIRNWVDTNRVALFPVWYVQVMVQILLPLAAILKFAYFRQIFVKYPLYAAIAAFAIAASIRFLVPTFIWDTTHLRNQLPYMYLWNFILGWVLYFCLTSKTGHRNLLLIVAFICLLLGMGVGWNPARSDFWMLGAAGTFFILVRKVRLPTALRQVAILLSEGAFFIFLVHRSWMEAINWLFPVMPHQPEALFAAALTGSFAMWFAFEAFVRAFRHRWNMLRRGNLPGHFYADGYPLALTEPRLQRQ